MIKQPKSKEPNHLAKMVRAMADSPFKHKVIKNKKRDKDKQVRSLIKQEIEEYLKDD